MSTLVVYHKNCWDGFCAAWLFHKSGIEATYVAAQYGDDPPTCKDQDVYIVDFSYPREVLWRIAAQAKSLTVLDHHQTAQVALEHFDRDWLLESGQPSTLVHFDMSKSGGRLTWEFLHQKSLAIWGERPWLVDYTEDRDLWRWALPDSREINACVRSYPLDFATWDRLGEHSTPQAMGYLIAEGRAILRRERQIIADHVAHAYEIEIDGHKVPCVNATTLFSDIAGELAAGKPFAVCWFQREDQRIQYSLRSDEQGLDVSEIAKAYGGGGHAHAAGFTSHALPADLGSPPGGWPRWEEGG